LDHTPNKNLQARLRRAFGQFWKYCLVGASGFILNLFVFWLMIEAVQAHYLVAASVSFAVAVSNNFILNKYWTFGNPDGDLFSQAGRFAVISITSWVLNLLILRLLIEDANMSSEFVAQTIAIAMVTVLNFSGNKLWSFRQPTAR
jgi:dolichol-phosphate mannosyltransferase